MLDYSSRLPNDNYTLFKNFINAGYPCIITKRALKSKNLFVYDYSTFNCLNSQRLLLEDLKTYLSAYNSNSTEIRSFVAVFDFEENMNEVLFEKKTEHFLASLNELDNKSNGIFEHVNSKFNLCENSFNVTGIHPNSSYKAKRSPKTALIFNLHWQFDLFKKLGAYKNNIPEHSNLV